MTTGLFDPGPARARHGATRALVHVPVGDGLPCPCCGWPAGQSTTSVEALFFHGGYGASRVARTVFCVRPNPDSVEVGCGWILTVDVSELRPPRRRWTGW